MQDNSLCVTCPHRKFGICGALLADQAEYSPAQRKPNWQRHQTARPGAEIAIRNRVSEHVFVLCDGWAYRFFQLGNGRRQILNFLLPGDLFSAVAVFEEQFSFSAKALTSVQFSGFRRAEIQARLSSNPDISKALARSCAADASRSDELLTALGQRSAEERIAYLFLHLIERIAARRVIREQRYPFPLRQQHIAEAVGLTPVHVSRVLGHFRDRGVMELSGGVLEVLDLPELQRIGALC